MRGQNAMNVMFCTGKRAADTYEGNIRGKNEKNIKKMFHVEQKRGWMSYLIRGRKASRVMFCTVWTGRERKENKR